MATAATVRAGELPRTGQRKFLYYFGPAFVASIAYIDPGNFAANFEGGTRFGYQLLWVLLWSNAMAILIQYLSAKLGIATGHTLPENCRIHFSRGMTIFLWVAAEISALATDLAEFLGAALGFYLLLGPRLMAAGMTRTNVLLLAAGYAPAYPQHVLEAPELDNVRVALGQVLAGHEPYPAVVVDRWWDVRDANSGLALLTAGCAPALLKPPVNALRLALHPDGMAPRIVNLAQWRGHLLTQLRHRAGALGDQRLADLRDELLDYPGGADETFPGGDVVLPLRYRHGDQELAMFSISARVSTATDVTVEELAIESFYPADAATASAFHQARRAGATAT